MIRGVGEVAINFDSFRNVDLFHQGIYCLQARVYREFADGSRTYAVPFESSSPLTGPEGAIPKGAKEINTAANVAARTFVTRSFLIRYCEEEVKLGQVARFRLETDFPWLQMQMLPEERESVVFEAALLFVDLSSRDGVSTQGGISDLNYDDFKVVSRATFRLHNLLAGIHEYLPVVFDEYHFCLAKCVIHTSIVDIRTRVTKLPPAVLEGRDQSPSKRNDAYPDESKVDINKKDTK